MRVTTRRHRARAGPPPAYLALVRGGLDAPRDGVALRIDPRAAVAQTVGAALLGALDEGGPGTPLSLALPACMEHHAVDAAALVDAMASLRAALLSVSGLDPAREPVPLAVGDAGIAALGFAEYLGGLLRRAASARAAAPTEVVAAAVALIR